MLFGKFSGGKFTVCDSGESLGSKDVGTALVIDGSRPHMSSKFDGKRISVVAFLHRATMALPADQLAYLRNLGFGVPVDPEPLCEPEPGVSAGNAAMPALPTSFDPNVEPEGDLGPKEATATIVEFCCGKRSRMGHDYGHADQWKRIRLTIEDDLTTEAGIRRAEKMIREACKVHDPRKILLWVSIPCTGGCPWQRINKIKSPSTRTKIERCIAIMKSLWASMTRVASHLLDQGGGIAIEWP